MIIVTVKKNIELVDHDFVIFSKYLLRLTISGTFSRRYTFLLISDYLAQADFCRHGYVDIPYYSLDMGKFLKVCDTIVEAILIALVTLIFSCTVVSSPIVTFFNLYAFILLTSTIVPGMNFFVVITRPLH